MPAAATHIEFGKDFLDAIPKRMRQQITDLPMFWMGTQGPDILYFHHMSFLPGALHKYGNMLHEEKIHEQFDFLFDYCKQNPSLESYLTGYLCHYALDCKAHGLICSIAQYEKDAHGHSKGRTHIRMEAEIDAYVCNQKGRHKNKNIWKSMSLSTEDKLALSKLYHELFKKVYNIPIKEHKFYIALTELILWNPLIRPRYIGQTITFGFEFVVSPTRVPNMIMHGSSPKEIINIEEIHYPCFWDKNKTISKSFPELYSEALELSYVLFKEQDSSYMHNTFMGNPIQNS